MTIDILTTRHPFLDDKPAPPDETGAAFGRFFSEMGERLFGEAV